ncbi:MAG: hypothetical protein IJG34_02665 [Synergistaceae bacterium]|nr:hypothetical protein [Synergistaceae bacterium]MBQ3448784.1 hypothetical protein [Synergistaceae bacterium]MBQ3693183.1 hypothetical protein [Synergistaceae bacterium]MBQ6111964.1 hypothetical protein [Synergistaceae bacterium]MBQ9627785.1 hypothetical protein [Synergistaceae bacterium]
MFIAFLKFLMRWFQRLVLLAGLIALGFWLFFIGREHNIYLDNRTMGEHKALEQVNVSINDGKVSELLPRDRDVCKVVGIKFEVKAEVFDDKGEIINTITKTIYPKCSKDIMINLPAMAAGDEGFIVPAPR